MDDAGIGKHCDQEGCHQKEYYSFTCSDCNKTFCGQHRHTVCPEKYTGAASQDPPVVTSISKEHVQCNADESC